MKLLLLILVLVASASATLFEAFERESRSVINDFTTGMQTGTPLHIALGIEDSDEIRRFERDLKDELKEYIKKAFENAYKKVIDAVEKGHDVNKEALDMLKFVYDKMKDLQISDDDVKKDIEELKSKVDKHLRDILEKMGIIDKRSADLQTHQSIVGDLDLRNLFLKLKQMILEKMDSGALKDSLARIVGQGAQKLCEWLTNKGKEKVLNFFDRVIEDDDEKRKRAAENSFQEVKDYLEDLEKDLETKASRFRQWLHDLISKGLGNAEDKIQKIREIIRKVINEGKDDTKKRLAALLDSLIRNGSELESFYEDLRNIIRDELKKTA